MPSKQIAHVIHRLRSFYHIEGSHHKDMELADKFLSISAKDPSYTIEKFLRENFDITNKKAESY